MRFWIALFVFVTGLVSSAVGFTNQLENQPISVINASASLTKPASYVLIPNAVLSAYEGENSVFAIGDGAVFMATGRESDIVAWLGDSSYVEMRLSVDKTKQIAGLVEIERPGSGELEDPAGADIWKTEVSNNGTALLPIELDNEVAVLMASTGIELAPRTLRVTWQLEETEAPIAPITRIGLVIMLVGALLGLYAAFVYGKKFRSRRNTSRP